MELNWPQLEELQLADECFMSTGRVDILLGADIYPKLMLDDIGVCKSPDGQLMAQPSIFGWIITGNVEATPSDVKVNVVASALSQSVETENLLKKFWEIEEVQSTQPWSIEEKNCEKHFLDTTVRSSDGSYVVSLPFKENVTLGESRDQAHKRFLQNERRLVHDPELKQRYDDVMNQYLELGYAEKVPEDDLSNPNAYYMPHHGVRKESSSTTKLRVVFDASAKTSNGLSLNDCLMVGPKVQDDLLSILMRFRTHPIAFSADIAKMYSQVKLNVQDRDYHRYLWRRHPCEDIQEYRMTTVTFGVTSSAYHAQRALIQLADDEGAKFPLAAPIVKKDFYVDDCLSGSDNVSVAMEMQQQLINMLKGGHFDLRKWSSNCAELLQELPSELCEAKPEFNLDLDHSDHVIKALGMFLSLVNDAFMFKVQPIEYLKDVNSTTKRQFLSDSARLFDPLGLLAPVLIKAKIMFQKLWLVGISWDDPLSDELLQSWKTWREQLTVLEMLRLPRCVVPKEMSASRVELHGFCDASESAYAAAAYLRTETVDGHVQTQLIAAKTKVSPLKTVSLPRLELCGAHLLTKLIERIQAALHGLSLFLHCWADSMVALSWIRGEPSKWKTFVGNRVSQIQDRVNPLSWNYCPSEENPADLATRGMNASEFLKHQEWYQGPRWLRKGPDDWPDQPRTSTTDEIKAVKQINSLVAQTSTGTILDLFPYSSFTKVVRVLAWCLRWIAVKRKTTSPGILAEEELAKARFMLVKEAQEAEFLPEIRCLKSGKMIQAKSKLVSLNTFLDENQVLRVGGRLAQSSLIYDKKFPIVLPKHHPLTKLIIECEHLKNLHAGPQLLIATLRQQYWILGARDVVRQMLHQCVICRRYKAQAIQQIMAPLPSSRVTQQRVFASTGVDFAGPILLKSGRGRGSRNEKAWIALFVCLVVKAVHLEVVTSLSTDAFLAAFRRFVGRRGKPMIMYSDNGTNFVGAHNELQRLIHSQEQNSSMHTKLQQDGVEWSFMPPKASHFGGLWEAGVKSVKFHLKRIVAESEWPPSEPRMVP